MKEYNFYFPIEQKYIPNCFIVKQPNAKVSYTADSLGNTTITWIAFGTNILHLLVRQKELVSEIESAAKDHYDTLGIEEPDFSDIEAQEKYLL